MLMWAVKKSIWKRMQRYKHIFALFVPTREKLKLKGCVA